MAVEPRAEQPNVKIEDEIEDDKAGWIENLATFLLLTITLTVVGYMVYNNLPPTGVKKIYA